MKLTLGFSPCPNDTFIFDALVNQKIDTEGLDIEVVLEDVQTLNNWAKQDKLDVTKLSYGVLPLVLENYIVLNSGGALGKGVGPLLITSQDPATSLHKWTPADPVAIPGENTTAHFLFSLAYPQAKNKVFLRFDEIEDFVSQGKGAGVIIHENRFTYQLKGLFKLVDLGDYWEQQTGNPIPLGGIVARRSLGTELQQTLERVIQKSLRYSFTHYPEISNYVRAHSQEMDENVMRKHIDLYVNNYTDNLGVQGQSAVLELLNISGTVTGPVKIDPKNVFLSN